VTNIVNDNLGNITVGNNAIVTGSLTVSGVAAVAVAPSTSGNVLTSNGTAWTSAAPSGGGLPTPSAIGQIPFSTNGTTYAATQKIVRGTAVASTSGTNIDFTSIPSWVKRITLMFNGVSTNGSSVVQIQLGSTSFVTSGYIATTTSFNTGFATTSSTTGFGLTNTGIGSSANTLYLNIIITNISSNTWIANFSGSAQIGTPTTTIGGGGVDLSGVLDRIRITTVNGTDTFDAGSINILYE
jgi:hypothetical protein